MLYAYVDCVWNVMAHAWKSDFVFRRNRRVHLSRRRRQFIRLLAAEVCASAHQVPRLCEEYWLPTPFASFPLHFHSRASPCAITFQLESTPRCSKLSRKNSEILMAFILHTASLSASVRRTRLIGNCSGWD